MIIEPSESALNKVIRLQVRNLFLLEDEEDSALTISMVEALRKTAACFQYSNNKYYKKNGETFFSIYHSGQYCIFLYFLSRQVFLDHPDRRCLADKIYYLNKTLNALDLYYEIEMPNVFQLDHPVGSVLGRAVYGNNFSFAQLCTVGNNKGFYPEIGENVQMFSGAKILGKCKIGDNVTIAANCYIKDQDVPANSTVFGASPDLIVKPKMA